MDFFRKNPQHDLVDENRRLAKAFSKAESKIKQLESAQHSAELQIQNIQAQNYRLLDKIARDHSKEISDAQTNYQKLEQKYETDLHDTVLKCDETIRDLNRKHQDHIQHLKRGHQMEVDRLKNQLITPSEENQGWPDDRLMTQYKDLQRLIDLITSPINRRLIVKPIRQLPPEVDHFEFCRRNGIEKYDFLQKSLIWSILRDQFFSLPFGFGVLGQGEGQRAITNLFLSWRELYDGTEATTTISTKEFEIFRKDKFANKWRCATFQSLQESLAVNTNDTRTGHLRLLSEQNQSVTTKRILDLLCDSRIVESADSSLCSSIQDEVRQIVGTARLVAFQFGINSSQLQLHFPAHGSDVIIGKDHHDCEDGDSDRGKEVPVDLVVIPSLQKIGDGRADMTIKRTIVPSEIYPILVP